MSEMIYNIFLQKNISSNKDNNFFNIISESESVFNKLHKYLLRQEIEFDNIFTEEKKDDKDRNVISVNFAINNLLNVLNKKDISLDFKKLNDIKDDKIEKKKLDKHQNNSLDIIDILKNIKNYKKNKIKEIFKILKTKTVSSRLIKNKNQLNHINEINNIGIIKKSDFKKSNDKLIEKKINVSNIDKKHIKFINNEKNNVFLSDIKKNKKSLYVSKNINKINNIIFRRNLLQVFDKKECIKSNIEPLILNNSKNSIEWKKLISHKILLSISNKNNQAEIYLKPESLGSIHILINMKNNAATLKFVSKYNEVRIFLDGYMPFLQNSLKKNGIKLEEFNICSSLKDKKIKSNGNMFYKNIDNKDNFSKTLNMYRKKLDFIESKPIDVYV